MIHTMRNTGCDTILMGVFVTLWSYLMFLKHLILISQVSVEQQLGERRSSLFQLLTTAVTPGMNKKRNGYQQRRRIDRETGMLMDSEKFRKLYRLALGHPLLSQPMTTTRMRALPMTTNPMIPPTRMPLLPSLWTPFKQRYGLFSSSSTSHRMPMAPSWKRSLSPLADM